MDFLLILLIFFVAGQALRMRYQRGHILLLAQHLAPLQIEQYMETLTQGYQRAIGENSETRQLQVFETFAQTEQAIASQVETLARGMAGADPMQTRIGLLMFCMPYAENYAPGLTRDFRELLKIHATSFRYIADNRANWSPKDRAFHMSAQLYFFQHNCHWFCKSRAVADARLTARHHVTYQKVLDSIPQPTRRAYDRWLSEHDPLGIR